MAELRQLYDDQGRPLAGKGASKQAIFSQGLLHAAAHVWIWRRREDGAEILVQKRASTKQTWPNLYDISAAGHIDVGETPLVTAVRETSEELGLDVRDADLRCIGVLRSYITAPDGSIENEFRWIYVLELTRSAALSPCQQEVDELKWVPFETFKADTLVDHPASHVPQGRGYFEVLAAAIEKQLTTIS